MTEEDGALLDESDAQEVLDVDGGDTLMKSGDDADFNFSSEEIEKPLKASVEYSPPPIDEFIRSFFVNMHFVSALKAFNIEWRRYKDENNQLMTSERQQFHIDSNIFDIPTVYEQNAQLLVEAKHLRDQLNENVSYYEKVRNTYDSLRKQKNVHKMHHLRAVQEKEKLTTDLIRLKKHCESYIPGLEKLKGKYEALMKEKTLMRIDRDKLIKEVSELKTRVSEYESKYKSKSLNEEESVKGLLNEANRKDLRVEAEKEIKNMLKTERNNWKQLVFQKSVSQASFFSEGKVSKSREYLRDIMNTPRKPSKDALELNIESLTQDPEINAHNGAVVSLSQKENGGVNVLLTAGEDGALKVWNTESRECILAVEKAHKAWVSCAKFSASKENTVLSSCCADGFVKIWEVGESTVVEKKSFKAHRSSVWSVDWCSYGAKLVSSGSDQTIRMYDAFAFEQRQVLRGHVDSVTKVIFSSFNDELLLSGSVDKSVSLWDARTGHCEITLFGHSKAVRDICFNPQNEVFVASCDASGEVFLWDIRKVSEIGKGGSPDSGCASCCAFSTDGKQVLLGTEKTGLQVFDSECCVGGEIAAGELAVNGQLANEKYVTSLLVSENGAGVFVGDHSGSLSRFHS